jgi:U2 small nuclear ribonucleoprotein B''
VSSSVIQLKLAQLFKPHCVRRSQICELIPYLSAETFMASSSNQPNTTLYINNLNDKVNKEELRSQLYAMFTTYGKIIDVVALKSKKMRGQAFLVFTDLAGATSAMRACEGMTFYDKPMASILRVPLKSHLTCTQRINYAKSKSWATLRREDPYFVPPTSANVRQPPIQNGAAQKRQREDDKADGLPRSKREKVDDDDAEEMEIDEEEEQAAMNGKLGMSWCCCHSYFGFTL